MRPLVGVGKQGGTVAVPIKSECCGFLSLVVYYIRLHPWGDFWKTILKPVIHDLGIVAYFNRKTAANTSNKYTVNMVISAIPRALKTICKTNDFTLCCSTVHPLLSNQSAYMATLEYWGARNRGIKSAYFQ